MREVPDRTGRFPSRPHYEPRELDAVCEAALRAFYRGGAVPVPIPTDDLTLLIERDTSDFDPGADLARYGPDVEGVTEFVPLGKPRVRVSAELAYDERREKRYRTTLAHEWGHVHLHAYLFELDRAQGRLFGPDKPWVATGGDAVQVCKRDRLLAAPEADWMEWQAGYVCGALLMPRGRLLEAARIYRAASGLDGAVGIGTPRGQELIEAVRATFRVSADAARVRLAKLGVLVDARHGADLFSGRGDNPRR